MKKVSDSSEIESDYRALIAGQRSLLLATNNTNGQAEISYAPFLQLENAFYIYVSSLAAHTRNMLLSRQASVMFIQAESEASDVFARKRLIYQCEINEINNSEHFYFLVMESFLARFGHVVEILRTLPDFHLLALTPQRGQYTAGFGQAYTIDVTDGVARINDGR